MARAFLGTCNQTQGWQCKPVSGGQAESILPCCHLLPQPPILPPSHTTAIHRAPTLLIDLTAKRRAVFRSVHSRTTPKLPAPSTEPSVYLRRSQGKLIRSRAAAPQQLVRLPQPVHGSTSGFHPTALHPRVLQPATNPSNPASSPCLLPTRSLVLQVAWVAKHVVDFLRQQLALQGALQHR